MMRRQANMRVVYYSPPRDLAKSLYSCDSHQRLVQKWFQLAKILRVTSGFVQRLSCLCFGPMDRAPVSSRHCAVRWDARWYQSMASQMLGSWKWSAAMETNFEWHGHPSESIRWVSQFSSFPLQVHRLWLVNHTDSFGSMNRMGSNLTHKTLDSPTQGLGFRV